MVKSLYIHIPFCLDICSYCDFCKIRYDSKYVLKYLDNLRREIDCRYNGEIIDTIYIGGGTPNSLNCDELKILFEIIKRFRVSDNLEYSIECNCECLDIDKILLFKEYGINRVSLGVQTFDDNIIKILNRHHTKKQVYGSVKMLKDNGINNINMDLIYGVDDNLDVIRNDISCFLELGIPHISCYSLIIEDGTNFEIEKRKYIDSDRDFEMYKYIRDTLKEYGYIQYEVSNYSKDGYQCRHNLTYWNNLSYYGFGVGAVSYIDNYRISNTKNLGKYLNGIYECDKVYEDKRTQMSNTMILGLRKTSGVSNSKFKELYGINIKDVYDIDDMVDEGMLKWNGDYLYIDSKYIYVSSDILINFIDCED